MEDLKNLRKIISGTSKCIREFNMIQKGDHIMVVFRVERRLYHVRHVHSFSKIWTPPFEITVVNMDQKQPGFPEMVLLII